MNQLLSTIFHPEVFLATNPPLFYALAALVGLCGTGHAWLRLLSLLCGVALVELTRRLALQLGLGRGQALVAAALVACSPLAIEYSTDFSHYAPAALIVTGSFVLLLRGLQHGRIASWHAYFTTMVVGFYFHYIFLVVGLAHTLFVLTHCWRHRHQGGCGTLRAFVRRGVVAALFVLPWLPVFFFSVEFGGLLKETTRHYYLQAPGLAPFLGDVLRATAGVPPRFALLAAVPALAWLYGLALHRRLGTQATLLLVLPLALLVIHLVSMYRTMTGFLDGGIYYPFRYALPLLPLAAIPVALALCGLVRRVFDARLRVSQKGLAAAAVLGCAVWVGCVGVQLGRLVLEPQRPDLRQAAELLRAELSDGDAVVVLPAFSHAQALTWYLLGDMSSRVVGAHWRPLPVGSRAEPAQGWFYGPLTDLSFHPLQAELKPARFRRVLVVSVDEGLADRAKFDHARILDHFLDTLRADYALHSERHLPYVRMLILESTAADPPRSFLEHLADRGASGG